MLQKSRSSGAFFMPAPFSKAHAAGFFKEDCF
jgi:hypothetical protein